MAACSSTEVISYFRTLQDFEALSKLVEGTSEEDENDSLSDMTPWNNQTMKALQQMLKLTDAEFAELKANVVCFSQSPPDFISIPESCILICVFRFSTVYSISNTDIEQMCGCES